MSLTDDLLALPTDFRLVRVGPNKRPIADAWFDVDDYTPDEAAAPRRGRPPAAWGLKSGPASGVVVLDLDAEGWDASFQEVTGHSVLLDLPQTISWTSGKPGRSGRAYAVDREWWPFLANRRRWNNTAGETCWELRGDRHQSVIVGKHPETGSYRWLEGCSPHDIPDPAPAPEWLLEALLIQELPNVEPVVPSAGDADRAVAMLQCLPAADFTSYDDWLRIGMALHHTDPGLLSAWVNWSQAMADFDEAECLAKWKSFDTPYKGRPATIGTLHYLAKKNGYKEPRRPKPERSRAGDPCSQSNAATPLEPSSAGGGGHDKPVALKPHQVLDLLPQRLGELSLNIRSGDVHSAALGILNGNQISRLYLQLSNHAEVWAKEATADGITLLASQNQFDPVADFLNGNTAEPLPMEQWQRLDRHLLGIDDPIAASFLPRFLISAVARVFDPGCYVRQVPVLVGPQERGKSALGEILFGSDQWVPGVNELDRDDLMRLRKAWGAELAELDGVTRRSDQERLKAFLTEKVDTYRAPYDRSPEQHARRFVFWGTSNGAPLRDTTGSTRFVCIPLPDRPLPLEWAKEHRCSLWARAVEQYRAGVSWIISSEDERQAIAERNSNFQEIDPWAEIVAQCLERARLEQSLPVKITYLLERLEVPRERQTSAVAKRVRGIAEQLGWEHGRRRPQPGALKKVGLWPGHPGHSLGTPMGAQSNPSDEAVSQSLGTPGTPIQQKLGEKVRGGQGAVVTTTPVARGGETFHALGVPGVPTAEIAHPATDQLGTGGVPRGVPRGVPSNGIKPWALKALKIRDEKPDHVPAQIALDLHLLGFKDITGQQIKALFVAHPLQEAA